MFPCYFHFYTRLTLPFLPDLFCPYAKEKTHKLKEKKIKEWKKRRMMKGMEAQNYN